MNWAQSLATLLVAAGLALFYILMELTAKSPRRIRVDGREYRMPDLRFHYSADGLYQMLDAAGPDNQYRLRRYWLLDFGFIACLLGVMLSIDLNVDKPATLLYLVMGAAAILRALLDTLENLLLLRVLRACPARHNGLAAFAGYVTSAKFLCLYVWVALLFVKLFARAFGLPVTL